jgi:hypothetical protein
MARRAARRRTPGPAAAPVRVRQMTPLKGMGRNQPLQAGRGHPARPASGTAQLFTGRSSAAPGPSIPGQHCQRPGQAVSRACVRHRAGLARERRTRAQQRNPSRPCPDSGHRRIRHEKSFGPNCPAKAHAEVPRTTPLLARLSPLPGCPALRFRHCARLGAEALRAPRRDPRHERRSSPRPAPRQRRQASRQNPLTPGGTARRTSRGPPSRSG